MNAFKNLKKKKNLTHKLPVLLCWLDRSTLLFHLHWIKILSLKGNYTQVPKVKDQHYKCFSASSAHSIQCLKLKNKKPTLPQTSIIVFPYQPNPTSNIYYCIPLPTLSQTSITLAHYPTPCPSCFQLTLHKHLLF